MRVIAIQLQHLSRMNRDFSSAHPPPGTVIGEEAVIALHNLTLGYERHPVVHDLSLGIDAGSMMAVVGPNGAGKSTLLRAMAGRLKPIGGWLRGPGPRQAAWLPQQSSMDRSFPISVQDMVALGLWWEVGALKRLTPAHHKACHEALATVGLLGFEKRGIDTLSGGQMQRALFARLILQDAPVVLLDEPFAALDQRTTADLLALLHRWQKQGKTVVAVMHDLAQVRANFPLTLLLARSPVAWGATEQVLSDSNWQRALLMQEPFDQPFLTCKPATSKQPTCRVHT
jgi:zinc/manganese transport system ATP-binding protein